MRASRRPSCVSVPPASTAPIATSVPRARSTASASGGSSHGKRSNGPKPIESTISIDSARSIRRTSGVSAAGRCACSQSVHNRTHTPGAVRPARPARWSALARLMASVRSALRPRRGSMRKMRARPLSTTMRTPGMVIDVSATLVATITLRRPRAAGATAASWRSGGMLPCSGTTSKDAPPATPRSSARTASTVRSISNAPGMKTSASPSWPSSTSRRTARAARSQTGTPCSPASLRTATGYARPSAVTTGAARYAAACAASIVALIAATIRSARRSRAARTTPSARSANTLRSWNSSSSTQPIPLSDGSRCAWRRKTPSVTKRIRVRGLTTRSKRVWKPTSSPSAQPISSATRRAVMRAASRRGSSTTICPCTHPARDNICGTCVVLPLPVAAVSTMPREPCMQRTISSAARSTGSGSPASLVRSRVTARSACGCAPHP